MAKREHFLNTAADNLTMEDTIEKIEHAVAQDKQIHHTVINAGKIVALQKDKQLRKSVNEADLINADGQAVVWASRILKKPLKERVAGIDLFINLLSWAHKNQHQVYLLGAKPEVLKTLKNKLSEKFSPDLVAGAHHGYFKKEEEEHIVQEIANSGARLLFVAITSPKKENFLHRHKDKLAKLNFIMGVGGSFDVLANKTKRAPKWMQTSGFEWLYRLIQEPKRMWKRYLIGNTKFIILVLKEKFSPANKYTAD